VTRTELLCLGHHGLVRVRYKEQARSPSASFRLVLVRGRHVSSRDMDPQTLKRIEKYKAAEREQKAAEKQLKEPLNEAERARNLKLKQAHKKRPGFGSSLPSVADHLNEVVGLTERKASKREERDKRIEAAAKSGAGVRRFEVAAQSSGSSKFNGAGQSLARSSKGISAAPTPSQAPVERKAGSTHMLGGATGGGATGGGACVGKDQRMHDARAAFLARLEQQQQQQH
jgi:hypothetical protein